MMLSRYFAGFRKRWFPTVGEVFDRLYRDDRLDLNGIAVPSEILEEVGCQVVEALNKMTPVLLAIGTDLRFEGTIHTNIVLSSKANAFVAKEGFIYYIAITSELFIGVHKFVNGLTALTPESSYGFLFLNALKFVLGHESAHVMAGDVEKIVSDGRRFSEAEAAEDLDRIVGRPTFVPSTQYYVEDEPLRLNYLTEAVCDIQSAVVVIASMQMELIDRSMNDDSVWALAKRIGIEPALACVSLSWFSVFDQIAQSRSSRIRERAIGNASNSSYPHPLVRLLLVDNISRILLRPWLVMELEPDLRGDEYDYMEQSIIGLKTYLKDFRSDWYEELVKHEETLRFEVQRLIITTQVSFDSCRQKADSFLEKYRDSTRR